jgi:hypothetical protein
MQEISLIGVWLKIRETDQPVNNFYRNILIRRVKVFQYQWIKNKYSIINNKVSPVKYNVKDGDY